jgi:hypothetical protein
MDALVAGVGGGDGVEARETAVAAKDAQGVVKSRAKWCEADAEADETEELGWFAAGRFK